MLLRQSEIERATRKPTESVGEAVVLLKRALVIDPSYAPAAANGYVPEAEAREHRQKLRSREGEA